MCKKCRLTYCSKWQQNNHLITFTFLTQLGPLPGTFPAFNGLPHLDSGGGGGGIGPGAAAVVVVRHRGGGGSHLLGPPLLAQVPHQETAGRARGTPGRAEGLKPAG